MNIKFQNEFMNVSKIVLLFVSQPHLFWEDQNILFYVMTSTGYVTLGQSLIFLYQCAEK